MNLLSVLKENPFVLAPMAGITDCPFRSFMRELGCGLVVTELVSAHGLEFNSQKTRKLMEYEDSQRPIGIQIFGETPETMARAAREVEEAGADFVDLNFGCPVPKVVKKGAGSAMLKDLVGLRDMLRAVKSAVSIPVTIKIRTGWDQASRNTPEVVQVAADEGMTWVAIHGRTRAQGYEGRADWDYIQEVKRNSPLPILGNGDLTSPEMAVRRLQDSGCDGVLIGRGCLKDPWIFRESLRIWSKGRFISPSADYLQLFSRLLFLLENYYDERLTVIQMKKFAAWYSSGYSGSAQFRKMIFQVSEKKQLVEQVYEFFYRQDQLNREDTSREAFLMGGHG